MPEIAYDRSTHDETVGGVLGHRLGRIGPD